MTRTYCTIAGGLAFLLVCGWASEAAGGDFSILAPPGALVDAGGKATDTRGRVALIGGGDTASLREGDSLDVVRTTNGVPSVVGHAAVSVKDEPEVGVVLQSGSTIQRGDTFRLPHADSSLPLRVSQEIPHQGAMALAFSPDGSELVSSHKSQSLWFWSTATGEVLARTDHPFYIYGGVASPGEGDSFLTSSYQGTLSVWSWSERRVIKSFPSKDSGLPNPDLLSNVSSTGEVVTLDARDQLLVIDGHTGQTKKLDFERTTDGFVVRGGYYQPVADVSSDGRLIVALGWRFREKAKLAPGERSPDYAAIIWNAKNGRLVGRTPALAVRVDGVCVSPTGSHIAMAADGGRIIVYSGEKWASSFELPGKLPFAFSPDGRSLVARAAKGPDGLVVWDLGNRKPRSLDAHWKAGFWERAIAFSHDGSSFAAAGEFDGAFVITLWATNNWSESWSRRSHSTRSVEALQISDDGRYMAYGQGGRLVVWDLRTGGRAGISGEDLWVPGGALHILPKQGAIVVDGWRSETKSRPRCGETVVTAGPFVVEHRAHDRTAFSGNGTIEASLDLHGRKGLTVRNAPPGPAWSKEWWEWFEEEPKSLSAGVMGGLMSRVAALEVSEAHSCVVAVDTDGRAVARDLVDGKPIHHSMITPFGHLADLGSAAVDRSTGYVAYANTGRVWLVDSLAGTTRWTWEDGFPVPTSVAPAFSFDHKWLAVPDGLGFTILSVADGSVVASYLSDSIVNSLAFFPSGKALAVGRADGQVVIWNTDRREEVAILESRDEKQWLVASPSGWFDAGRMDMDPRFRWRFRDDPRHVLSPDAFTRDYFKPGLLARILSNDLPADAPAVYELNRALPLVSFRDIRISNDGVAHVRITVRSGSSPNTRRGVQHPDRSGVYDVRVLAGGVLRARLPLQAPGAFSDGGGFAGKRGDAWRVAAKILEPAVDDGKELEMTFRVPTRSLHGTLEFAAYAFNANRVKGRTVKRIVPIPPTVRRRPRRAFLVTVGVSGNANPNWRLSYASYDADSIGGDLEKLLVASGQYSKVEASRLTRDPDADPSQTTAGSFVPTRSKIEASFGRLSAGRVPSSPDDDVIIVFSGHGLVDPQQRFGLVPYDLPRQSGSGITPGVLSACIRGSDLEAWLRGIEARRFVLVLDCCHAAASVQEGGFLPAPLGNPGFGQLSYDKGMLVIAATEFYGSVRVTGEEGASPLTSAIEEGARNIRGTRGGSGRCTLTLEQLLRTASNVVLRSKGLADDDFVPPAVLDYGTDGDQIVLAAGRRN
jgi:WD40 repeat protein